MTRRKPHPQPNNRPAATGKRWVVCYTRSWVKGRQHITVEDSKRFTAPSWFSAREQAARHFGCEPGELDVRRFGE